MSCNIKLRREGKTYPRTCITCLTSKRCAHGLDEDSLIEAIANLNTPQAKYAIVTSESFYDGFKTEYDKFSEYDYESFEKTVRILALSNKPFRAFRIIPISVTTNTNINIGL